MNLLDLGFRVSDPAVHGTRYSIHDMLYQKAVRECKEKPMRLFRLFILIFMFGAAGPAAASEPCGEGTQPGSATGELQASWDGFDFNLYGSDYSVYDATGNMRWILYAFGPYFTRGTAEPTGTEGVFDPQLAPLIGTRVRVTGCVGYSKGMFHFVQAITAIEAVQNHKGAP